jgi:hypothetical protein
MPKFISGISRDDNSDFKLVDAEDINIRGGNDLTGITLADDDSLVIDDSSLFGASPNGTEDTTGKAVLSQLKTYIAGMFSNNTETFISAAHDTVTNTIDLVVPVLDEDNMSTDSNTHLATQQSIKAYVDSSVTSAGGGDITGVTIQTDTGSGSKATDDDGSADFIINGGGGISVTNSAQTITVTGASEGFSVAMAIALG